MACFGIRNRLKPFSSTVLFEDQSRNNPAPDVSDPEGSLIDGELLAEYVVHSTRRLAPYADRTVCLLAVEDQTRALLLEPPEGKLFPDLAPAGPVDPGQLQRGVVNWLQSG
jgi:hypothetical protein